MTKSGSFKLSSPVNKRMQDSAKLREKYPDRIPVIVEISHSSTLQLDKNKYLVPPTITVGQFQYILRKKVPNLNPQEAIYMFINKSLCPIAQELGYVYNEKKDIDGFLYIIINTENTFGSYQKLEECNNF